MQRKRLNVEGLVLKRIKSPKQKQKAIRHIVLCIIKINVYTQTVIYGSLDRWDVLTSVEEFCIINAFSQNREKTGLFVVFVIPLFYSVIIV